MSHRLGIGSACWLPFVCNNDTTGEIWQGAVVIEKKVQDEKVLLKLEVENGEIREIETTLAEIEQFSASSHLPALRNPPMLEATDDLSALSFINEPSVLHNIKTRYSQLAIYTYSGIVLIAINPFQSLNLYSPEIVQAYAGRQKGELDPHLFAIAEDAYRCMIRDNANQTIVVSGESGAGKTVSAKYIMRYFATVEDPERLQQGNRHRKSMGAMSKTEEQILATNPVLEAFGNAKTTRNDNSSRFGKYIEIMFDTSHDIIGAKIRTYLLERSRLVFLPKTERNYHIFYQLCRGANSEQKESLFLKNAESYHYLRQGGDLFVPNVDDASEFDNTCQALATIGIEYEVQMSMFRVLAGVLQLGNIVITASQNNAFLSSHDEALLIACNLFEIEPSVFSKWLTKKQIATRSEKILTTLSQKQALTVRDSLSKYIYTSLFDWLVKRINLSLATPEITARCKTFIGVLDIYGFEHFHKNSFEQFCINYANEKLQQEFNQHIFKLEQDEYVREEINWQFIEFSDNQPCIDLIEGKLGILSLLDEESRLPSGTDESWTNKLFQTLHTPKHDQYFKKPRFGTSAFTICHYALEVTYESDGFLEKNRDSVPDEQLEVLMSTKNAFFKEILETHAMKIEAAMSIANGKRGNVQKKSTLGSIFKQSLIGLMETINSTNVHYIRCIKPNESKDAWVFDSTLVLGQLRACGVIETIRISCAGFPTRWTFEEFASRYYPLVHSDNWTSDAKDFSVQILSSQLEESDRHQIGKTKVFFRPGMLAYLEKLRTDRLDECAVVIQKNMLCHLYQKQYLATRNSIIRCQTVVRGYLMRKRYQAMRECRAATIIQKYYKGRKQRLEYLQARKSIISIQTMLRSWDARRKFTAMREAHAATKIQSNWRRYVWRKFFLTRRKNIVILQNVYRRRVARSELKRLRAEARSMDRMKEVSYRLENKVVELTQTLAAKTLQNKELEKQLSELRNAIDTWQAKYNATTAEKAVLLKEFEEANKSVSRVIELDGEIEKLRDLNVANEEKLSAAMTEIEGLQVALRKKSEELADALETIRSHKSERDTLSDEINTLKKELEELSRGVSLGLQTPILANGGVLSIGSVRRTQRIASRRDFSDGPLRELGNANNATMKLSSRRSGNISAPKEAIYTYVDPKSVENIENEIQNLLDNDEILSAEATIELIRNLMIPLPNINGPSTEREILFPAQLINLVTSQLWKFGFVKESERFLANVMQTIQQVVTSFESEQSMTADAFWLSNVHEMLSFVCLAENDLLQNANAEMDDIEWQEYERLVSIVKHDLESLEYNIHHLWMSDLRKKVQKLVVPAVIECQSLPGFMTSDGNRFINKLLQGNTTPTATMDDLINLLNRVHKAMTAYFLDNAIISQVILTLLRVVGVTAFNDLLMRRNFLSWKRGLQISYNITRIEEWCKSHDLPEGILQLEHLMQAVKLAQLKKSTLNDIDIIYDICWMLTPAQLQKLITQYHTADYEHPISPDILKAVAAKVLNDDKNDTLLLNSSTLEENGEYVIPEPRIITTLETYVPGWLHVPNIRALSQLIAAETDIPAQLQPNPQKSGADNEVNSIHKNPAMTVESTNDAAELQNSSGTNRPPCKGKVIL